MKNTPSHNTLLSLIKKPRITEKAAVKAESHNVYTFEVTQNATKTSVAQAIHDIYKLKPIRVNIVRLPAKKVISRGKQGISPRIKKALVFLKKGDKIAFI